MMRPASSFSGCQHEGRGNTRRPAGPVHLSADGKWTLCHWRIRDDWLVSTVPVPLSILSYYGVCLCRACRRAAGRLELERRERTP